MNGNTPIPNVPAAPTIQPPFAPQTPATAPTIQSVAQSVIHLYKTVNRVAFLLPIRIGLAVLLYFGLMQVSGLFEIVNMFTGPNAMTVIPTN